MSGYIMGDPYWLPDPAASFLSATQTPPGPLRIAFATAIEPIGVADAPCQEAVLKTVQLLEALGHTVEPGCPDVSDLIEPFTLVWRSVLSEAGIPFIFLGKMNRWLLNRSRFDSSGKYLRAVSKMQIIARRIVAFFDTVDVLVLPTYLHTTIRIGEWATLRPAKTMEKIIGWVAPCPPFNATGQPVITIPTGFDPHGLPIGIQLIGRPADEATLIALAAQIEAAAPWQQRRPLFAIKDR
jgi:amidase